MKALGWTVTYIGSIILSSLWSGYVFSVLWRWFITSQFEGMPQLSIPGAIGLALVIRYLTYHDQYNPDDKREQSERLFYAVFMGFVWPLFALVFGWVVQGFL